MDNNLLNNLNNSYNHNQLDFWNKTEPTEYSYILMYNDCSGLKDEVSSKQAWSFISKIATSGCTFGRGMAGSMFFTSTWDIEQLKKFFSDMKMEYVLYRTDDTSSIVRVADDDNKDTIHKFFRNVLK